MQYIQKDNVKDQFAQSGLVCILNLYISTALTRLVSVLVLQMQLDTVDGQTMSHFHYIGIEDFAWVQLGCSAESTGNLPVGEITSLSRNSNSPACLMSTM